MTRARCPLASRLILASLFFLLSLSACGDGSSALDEAPLVSYLSYRHPDSLMANYALAWNGCDIREYAKRVLYGGDEEAADGRSYEPFVFYLAGKEGGRYGLDEELRRTGRLFSGEDGHDGTPGVASLSVVLHKIEDWMPLAHPGEVYGDPYPEGTLRSVYDFSLIVKLKGNLPNSRADRFIVTNYQEFFAIPVDDGEGVSWRLWKQHDLGSAET